MSNKISRRNFLHTAGLGTLGAAAAGLLTACGDKAASGSVASSAAAAGTYTAGTYSATATGINTTTPVTVTMTFSADAITDVQIDVANETKGYGADIADEMVKKILDAQSSEVDGHSGATITSGAIKKAAESCINQAKGVAVAPTEANKAETVVPDSLSVEEVESSVVELGDITPDETKDFDVVVVGAGAAGVPAAGWAAELGGHVALLQKQSIVVSQGNCGSAIIKSKSTDAGKKMWVHMTNGLCDWRADTSLLNAYVENSEEALMWYLNRAGLTDQTEYGDGSLVDSNKDPSSLLHNDEKEIFAYMCTSQDLTGVWKDRMDTYDFGDEHCYFFAPWIGPKPKNVGDVLATVLENVQAKNSNLETFFNTPAVKLVHENGKVTGAIAKGSDGYIKINASKGTVVCTGGYARNEDMLKALQPQTLNKYSLSIAIDGTTGDGIKSCLWAGARMDEVHTAMVFDRVAVKPDEFGGAQTTGSLFWMGSNPWLKVNLNGERFANESGPYDYILNAALTQPNHTVVDIWDSDYETYLEQFDIHGCARVYPFENGAPTNMTLETVKGINEGLLADGYIVKADTIEELAKGLGLPVENLKKTVDRQNENYDNQVDPDFGKEAFRLSPVRKAPFYGVRTSGYMLCTLDGITINENFQAVNEEGEAIEGLYVTGVDSGSYYAHTYPNMSTGNCCGRSVTFARMIGKALAAK